MWAFLLYWIKCSGSAAPLQVQKDAHKISTINLVKSALWRTKQLLCKNHYLIFFFRSSTASVRQREIHSSNILVLAPVWSTDKNHSCIILIIHPSGTRRKRDYWRCNAQRFHTILRPKPRSCLGLATQRTGSLNMRVPSLTKSLRVPSQTKSLRVPSLTLQYFYTSPVGGIYTSPVGGIC